MPGDGTLKTDRLLLRPWSAGDRALFAELNADPDVMEWFPSTLTRLESDALAERIEQRMDVQGWGLWAVEVPGIADFIGFVGLSRADETLGYPSVEVGWRLAATYWGRGYAFEGALAALRFGFQKLALGEIVSFTSVGNIRSRRVMEKLGMVRRPEKDFDHPRIPKISHLCRHVLYRITRSAFSTRDRSESSPVAQGPDPRDGGTTDRVDEREPSGDPGWGWPPPAHRPSDGGLSEGAGDGRYPDALSASTTPG